MDKRQTTEQIKANTQKNCVSFFCYSKDDNADELNEEKDAELQVGVSNEQISESGQVN